MATKRIPVGNGYEVQFTARAQGEETPHWRGFVWQNGREVAAFKNDGTGGATHWTGVGGASATFVAKALCQLVEEASPGAGTVLEAEDLVLYWAEERGYARRGSPSAMMTLRDYVRTARGAMGAGATS